MRKQIITKKELQEIQKYWRQVGGFGGELSSGVSYYSETGGFGRTGVLEIFDERSESFELKFYEGDTIEDIKKRVEKAGFSFYL